MARVLWSIIAGEFVRLIAVWGAVVANGLRGMFPAPLKRPPEP